MPRPRPRNADGTEMDDEQRKAHIKEVARTNKQAQRERQRAARERGELPLQRSSRQHPNLSLMSPEQRYEHVKAQQRAHTQAHRERKRAAEEARLVREEEEGRQRVEEATRAKQVAQSEAQRLRAEHERLCSAAAPHLSSNEWEAYRKTVEQAQVSGSYHPSQNLPSGSGQLSSAQSVHGYPSYASPGYGQAGPAYGPGGHSSGGAGRGGNPYPYGPYWNNSY